MILFMCAQFSCLFSLHSGLFEVQNREDSREGAAMCGYGLMFFFLWMDSLIGNIVV